MQELLDSIYNVVHIKIETEGCRYEDFKIIMRSDLFNELIKLNIKYTNREYNGKRKGLLFGVELLSSKELQQEFILTDNENRY